MNAFRACLVTATAAATVLAGCASGPQGPHLETGGQALHDFGHVVDRVAGCDFTGDGRQDFVASGRIGEGQGRTTVIATGAGRFRSELSLERDFAALTTGDFDADDRCDFAGLSGPNARSDARIFFGEDGRFPATASRSTRRTKARALTAGDITGDGVTDLVVVYKTFRDRANVAVFPGGPDRDRAGGTRSYRGPEEPAEALAADFDGDGDTDLAVLGTDRRLTVLANRGGRLKADGARAYGQPTVGGRLRATLTAGDFDGDGDADLAVADAGENRVFLFTGDTHPSIAATFRLSQGSPLDLAPADLDGDGDADLAVLADRDPRLMVLQVGDREGAVTVALVGTRELDDLDGASRLRLTDLDESGHLDAVVWGHEDDTPQLLSLRAVRIVTP